jgi:tripartite-type tricarboxylate transporter receptor subunit TctC
MTFAARWIACLAVLCGTAQAQNFPDRPITLYCPWTAGGPTDIGMRALAEAASKQFGQRIIIENKPGAGGALGAQQVAGAKPDGYTLAQAPLGVFRLPHMVKTSFEPLRDLTWIIGIAGYQFGLTVRADAPYKTWDEFIRWSKANPNKVSYASPGVGTSLHLTMEDLGLRLGVQWLHIPYKGSADAVTALRSGEANSQAGSPPWELVDANQARTLVMWTENRSPRAPAVPTLKELYGIVANSPWGIVGPKGMDARLVKTLHDGFKRALDDPAFRAALERAGMEPYYQSSDDFAQWARRMLEEEGRAVERLGLRPQN